MFTVIKDGKEIGSMYYFGDALYSLLKAYDEQKRSIDNDQIVKRTFIIMTWDEKEKHDISIPLAKKIGGMLDLFKDDKIVRERGYHDKRRIMKIMTENYFIKKVL